MHSDSERARARQLSAESVAAGDATGWFERLYAEAEAGVSVVPWADGLPDPQLVAWADGVGLDGAGRRALVPVRDPAMMPWPLTPAELTLAGGPLRAHRIEKYTDDEDPPRLRWRAEFRRDG